jgi:predicted RNase H-like nuclease
LELKEKAIKLKGKVRIILEDEKTGIVVKDTGWVDNVVPTVGRTALAKIMAGVDTISNPGKITYCAVGTGTVVPNITGTKLTTEIERVLISAVSTNIDNEVNIRAFFTTLQGNGSLKELGLFGEDADATADSGTLFQWIAFNVVKTTAETMTVLSKIPINYE